MFDSTCITTHPNQSLIILSLYADDRFHPIDHGTYHDLLAALKLNICSNLILFQLVRTIWSHGSLYSLFFRGSLGGTGQRSL